MHTEDQEEFTGSPTGGNSNTSHPMVAPFRRQGPGLAASPLSPFRLLATIIGAIFMAEVIAMLVVYALGPIPFVQLTLLDAGIMTGLIFPVLYFLSFQPLLRYIQKSQQAEAALVHAMDLQERFFDSIDTLIAYMDRDFNFIRVNEAYARADGRKPEYFIGRNHFDLYPHPENRVIFQRVVETGEGYSVYEKPFEYPEALERGITYWNWSLLPVKGVEGRVEGVVLSLVDVTVRKRAEEKNRQLSRIVEQTADSVVVTDCVGVIEYVNPAFEWTTGYTKEEALGKTPNLLKSGVHDARFYQELWKTILEGEIFQSEIANRKKNGELFYEVKTITPLRNERGDITHFVATGKDISERKKAEDKLLRSYEELELRVQSRTEELRFANSELEEEIAYRKRAEDKLQRQTIELELQTEELRSQKEELIFANARLHQSQLDLDRAQKVGQIGSWRLDVRHNILSWSDECYRIFGVPKGTPQTYETFLRKVHPDDRQYVDMQWNAALGGDSYNIEHRLLVDGQVKWVKEKAYLEFDDAKNLLGGFGTTQDITERKLVEAEIQRTAQELQDANEELTRFNNLMVGREMRMIELKKEVNELCSQTNQPARYPLEFEKEGA